MNLTYLEQLTIRVAQGLAALPEELRARHTGFLKSKQQPDGGFAGREGGSDLYYTGFGLRALAVLGELHGEVAERSAAFLQQKLSGQESIIDFLSLIYGATLVNMSAGIDIFAEVPHDWRTVIAGELENLRREDGGYAKGKEGRASSTYHTFLVTICLELIERPLV
jgi:geranylgeranyl transferase type-2 subunit beta